MHSNQDAVSWASTWESCAPTDRYRDAIPATLTAQGGFHHGDRTSRKREQYAFQLDSPQRGSLRQVIGVYSRTHFNELGNLAALLSDIFRAI